MVNDLDLILKQNYEFFKNTPKEKQAEALKKEGYTDADIAYILEGKLSEKQIKKWKGDSKLTEHGILLTQTELGELLVDFLKPLSMHERVKYLVQAGLEKDMAKKVAHLVDEMKTAGGTLGGEV